MYVEPNSTIKILRGFPLINNYVHTLWFDNATAQTNYMNSFTRYTFNNQTYQRVERSKIRLQINAESIYDCNYLMFQNTSFGSKWFYAFISNVEYINNIVSEVTFEIDVMQTWFFNYSLAQCFVEREHAMTDAIGDNLVPEDVELGDYVTDDFSGTDQLGPRSIVIAATFDAEYKDVQGTFYSGMFSGCMFHTFENSSSGATAAIEFLEGAATAGKADGIVSVFLMPTAMVTPPGRAPANYVITKSKNISSIGGYVPKNKKLFTYPYNFLYVTNLQGNSAAFRYEFFSGNTSCQFNLAGDFAPNPSVILTPRYYKGIDPNFDEKLSISGWPQLSYNVDTFKQWVAQNASSLAVNGISTALSYGAAGGAVGGPVGAGAGAAAGLISSVAGTLSQIYQASIRPNQAHGGGGSQTLAAMALLDFGFMHKHITPQFARIIDEYFTMYGYATHRVKRPNRNGRKRWNYVKTIGCSIIGTNGGSVPADDMNRICEIYDRGITFWKNGADIGNYALDNSL